VLPDGATASWIEKLVRFYCELRTKQLINDSGDGV
jgi:hypothetical protein